MDVFLDTCISTLTQGLIYALLSCGIYITYKILDFPDLTVDGSFPLGAAVTAVLLTRGVNPWLTLAVAMAVGAAAGLTTGLIHVRLKVRDLLAGIITMTALFSINLQIAGSNLNVERAMKTIWPVPMVAEKERCSWQTTAPHRATSALAITSPRIFTEPLSRAREVTTLSLSPTARSSRPFFVRK